MAKFHGYCESCKVWTAFPKWRIRQGTVLACPGCGRTPLPIGASGLRAAILRSLGFATYAEYMLSDLWQSIRRRVLEKSDKCVRCGKAATQVHHRLYSLDAMTGKDISYLVPVCASCHEFAEFHPDGRKAQRSIANKKFDGTYTPGRWRRSRPDIGRRHAKR